MLRNVIPVVLANSATVSAVATSKGQRLAGVYLPHGFSGSAITFLASYGLLNNVPQTTGLVSDGAGASYTRTCRADDYVPIPKDVGCGIDQVQIISGTSQSGAVTLLVVFVDI